MKHIVLASTSTVYQGEYLDYLLPVIKELFAGINEIIFIPYARPGGITHDEYTSKTARVFETAGISIRGLHTLTNLGQALQEGKGFFTGGGNTFLLVKQLHDQHLMQLLAEQVKTGKPYL